MNTKPGDLSGPDSHGKWRVSREIPLPWLLGIVAFLIGQAATIWFGQQQLTDDMREVKETVREIGERSEKITGKDIEHSLQIIELQRRVSELERKGGKL